MFTTDVFDIIFKNWSRPVMESQGYKIRKTEKGYTIIVNTLGISEDDLEVKLENKVLSLSGNTEIKELSFTNKVNYSWTTEYMKDPIKKIRWESKNGLTLIYVETEQKKEPQIKVERIKQIFKQMLEAADSSLSFVKQRAARFPFDYQKW